MSILLLLSACAKPSLPDEQTVADNLLISGDVETVDAGAADPAERFPTPTIDYFPSSLGEPSLSCPWGEGRLDPIMSDFERRWYSHHLSVAGEQSLYLAAANRLAGATTLRFTWLPSFHHPVIVRIETAPSGEAMLHAVSLSGAGGYEPGTVDRRIDRKLSADEIRKLKAVLMQARLFRLPPKLCDGGTDGAGWIFEGIDEAGYHYFERWTPRKGPARKVGLFLLSLTGWRFEMVY